MEIRGLRPGDNLASFRTGDPQLDLYFQNYAASGKTSWLGVPYLALASRWVVGGLCLSRAQLIGLASPLQVLRVSRLGVDRSARGQGIAAQLLAFALRTAWCLECDGVLADARGSDFFRRYGFTPLELWSGQSPQRPRPVPMFLPMRVIAGALGR